MYSNHSNHWDTYIFIFVFVVVVFFLLLSRRVIADNTIFINEFLIEPTPQQVEIINTGTETMDISGWYINDNGGTSNYYTIHKNTILLPNSCQVFSGDFGFNKVKEDRVRLFNSSAPPTSSDAQLIDSFSYVSSLGQGNVYMRLPDGSATWATGTASFGQYNSTKKNCIITPAPTPTSTPTMEQSNNGTISSPPPVPTPISYNNIYISEVMVNPDDNNHEWVELFNRNDFPVVLFKWYIDDIENAGASPKMFSLDLAANGYGVYELTGSMFNNDGDNVRLLDYAKNIEDSFEYSFSTQGKTLGRTSWDSDEFCLQEPSKNLANNSCIDPTATPIPTPTKIPKSITLSVKSVIRRPTAKSPRTPMNQYRTTPIKRLTGEGEILGIADVQEQNNQLQRVRILSLLPLTYSLLTIISVLIKIKKGIWKT